MTEYAQVSMAGGSHLIDISYISEIRTAPLPPFKDKFSLRGNVMDLKDQTSGQRSYEERRATIVVLEHEGVACGLIVDGISQITSDQALGEIYDPRPVIKSASC